jgi:hypothetical protein
VSNKLKFTQNIYEELFVKFCDKIHLPFKEEGGTETLTGGKEIFSLLTDNWRTTRFPNRTTLV